MKSRIVSALATSALIIIVVLSTAGISQADPVDKHPAPPSAAPGRPLDATGSAFTYQGSLKDGGSPANGPYDLRFTLYDAATGGAQVGSPITLTNQTVTGGLFTVPLDFGANAFQGRALWLEIAVQPAGGGGFTTLSPRQALTPAPYAMSLVPGAVISGTNGSALLTANNADATGLMGISNNGSRNAGVYGYSTALNGNGLIGWANNGDLAYGVWGNASNGYGVVGVSYTGTGVLGKSSRGPGGDFSSTNSDGVHSVTGAGGSSAVYGLTVASNGQAIVGDANTGTTAKALWGRSTAGYGMYSVSISGTGAYGQSTSGVGGSFVSTSNDAVQGRTTSTFSGVAGFNAGSGPGTYGQSTSGYGVFGNATSSDGVHGVSTGAHGVSGQASASGKSGVVGTNNTSGGYGVSGTSTNGNGVYGQSTNDVGGYFTSTTHDAIQGHATAAGYSGVAGFGGSGGNGVYGWSPNASAVYAQSVSGNGVSGTSTNGVGGYFTSGGNGVYAQSSGADAIVGVASYTGTVAVHGTNAAGYGIAGSGVTGVSGTGSTGNGVFGTSSGPGNGVYGFAAGSNTAVRGTNSSTGDAVYGYNSSSGNGVHGTSISGVGGNFTSANNDAVLGHANSTFSGVAGFNDGTGPGVFGTSVGGYAGRFDGDVQVNGTLTANIKNFKIDDPLDPANKYLYHTSVESSDMMNIYNGNVTLDGAGEAWVQMPAWFQALNQDFRYQLTAIGAPGPNLYVAQEIANNRFKIAGGKAGTKVSWQVAGVRHDPYAQAHPSPVEQTKPASEQGLYMHPELYNQPASKGLNSIYGKSSANQPGTTTTGGK